MDACVCSSSTKLTHILSLSPSPSLVIKDSILFKCVPSKYDTEVKVVISGKRLAFHTTHSFDDKDESGEAVVRTIKSTQTFTLPWAVSLDLISFVPVQNEGQHVKVMKPLPLQVSETPVEIYIKPLP